MVDTEKHLEKYETLFKELGGGETSGRILGLLLIGKEPKLSLDQLSDKLNRSRSTVHTGIKKLLEYGIITYDVDDDLPSEGRYQHLYFLNPEFWEARITKLDALSTFKHLLFDAIEHHKTHDPADPRISPLQEIHALYDWFEDRLPELFKEWEEIKKKRFG